MTPIDKYLSRVKFWLPGRGGAAAAADLRGVLAELVQDREQDLGRPLTNAEVEDLLAGFGRPEVIASRYSSVRPLVSAGLMPAYLRVLAIAMVAVVLVQALLAVGALPAGAVGEAITTAAGRTVTGLLWSFTGVTLAFAGLTRVYAPAAGESDC